MSLADAGKLLAYGPAIGKSRYNIVCLRLEQRYNASNADSMQRDAFGWT